MRKLLSIVFLLVSGSVVNAQCPKCGQFHYPYNQVATTAGSNDALNEVNAARRRAGKRPFIHDPLLTIAAQKCASIRASRLIAGHLSNDFSYVPAGGFASSAGCGAMEDSWGWGTCCTYENYTYAGAAWVRGRDGKRYMHLFVR